MDQEALPEAPAFVPNGGGRGPTRSTRPHRLGLTALVAAAASVVVLVLVQQADLPAAQAYAATPLALPLEYEAEAPTAQDVLRTLAVRTSAPAGAEAEGAFNYIRTKQWSLDISAAGGTVTSSRIVPQQVELWRAADGSGRRIVTTLPAESGTGEGTDHPSWAAETDMGTFGPGGLAAAVPDPVPTEQTALAQALYAHQPKANGPKSAVRAVADLYRYTAVRREARAAVLTFLAGRAEVSVGS